MKAYSFSLESFLDYQKDHNLSHWCINLLAKKSGQLLFYGHVQIFLSAFHKPKQTWSVESFPAFARLKEWPSTSEHVFINNR